MGSLARNRLDVRSLLSELKVCTSTRNLQRGKTLHAEATACGIDSCTFVANSLVNMYAKCHSMHEAKHIFDTMKQPDVVSWNSLILGYAENGEGFVALDLFEKMTAEGCAPDSITFVGALKACSSLASERGKLECLKHGKKIHARIGRAHMNAYVQNTLIDVYAKSGMMEKARLVFADMTNPNVVSWNTLILGYAENDQGATALDLFEKMSSEGRDPNRVTFVAALKACTSLPISTRLARVKQIQSEVTCYSDIFVQNTLIDTYCKSGDILEAKRVFDKMKQPDVVSWTALISGYADNGEGDTALDLFSRMSCKPNSITFLAAFKACIALSLKQDVNDRVGCLDRARQLHSQANVNSSTSLQNALIDMYAKCGGMVEAHCVFDNMKRRNVISWNALMLGYAENGNGAAAWDLFGRMRSQGCVPDPITYVAALKSCIALALKKEGIARRKYLERGKHIHLELGVHTDIFVQNTLIDMYSKFGSMTDARQVFDAMKKPNVVSWTILIMGYAENGEAVTALDMFSKMKLQGCAPNSITFIAALRACGLLSGNLERLELVKQLHSEIGFCLDIHLENALIDMYAKCGCMFEARHVFDSMKSPNVVSWTSLILGYAENGQCFTALEMFSKMRRESYVRPDSVTFIAALKACSMLALEESEKGREECLEKGRKIHQLIGSFSNTYVQNSLIDMYAKCGSMVEARQVFDSMNPPSVVSYNALILGYADNGEGAMALNLLGLMRSQGFSPNSITFVSALKACALLGDLEFGTKIHAEITSSGETNEVVLTSLVDFYAKCGNLFQAQKVFNECDPRSRDLTTWTALLAGYKSLGNYEAVFEHFQGMLDAGFQPNAITFSCVLTSCSHAGLIERASEFFEVISTTYKVIPTLDHYNCMVDMFGRSNKLDDAMALLRSMPCRQDAVTWTTLLGSCHKWKNVGVGRLVFRSLVSLNDASSNAYVLMANIYGSRDMHEEQQLMRSMSRMQQLGGTILSSKRYTIDWQDSGMQSINVHT